MTNFTFTHSKPKIETIGNWVREKNRSLFGSGMRWYNRNSPVGRQAVAMEKETLVKDANGKEWILKPDGTKILASVRKAKQQVARNNTQTAINPSIAFAPWNKLSNIDQEEENNQQSEGDQGAFNNTTTTKTRTGTGTEKYRKNVIKRKITPKGQEYWNSKYQTFLDSMTDDQKAWLKQQGIDYSTAQRMQGYLSGMGENIGNTGMDNKWGPDSQKAWENFVNTTMKNTPLQTPTKKEPLVDSPDPFGYKTSNTYEADDFVNKVKALGIKSNADLMHFMYESGKEGWKGDEWTTQFRNDVDRLLGGDYSDDNIKKVFKTKNSWGIGFTGRGDFGDFQNALQTNAGLWNGAHDQKELASRTDSDGNVYSNSNVAKLFDKQSISSKIADIKKYKFPDLNFNLKQGNIGISTLGNQPGIFDAANYEGIV